MRISDYLDSRLISFLDVESRDLAIDSLINLLSIEGYLPRKEAFRTAIFEREAIVSTGIGMGVAVPHAKLNDFTDFFIAVGIQRKSGLDWNSMDQTPVRLIFMIGGPDDRQNEYLQILSLLTSIIRDVDLRKKLLSAKDSQEAFNLFS